ncbi:MAG: hypothetical protein AAGJ31_06430 [Verrucomicrobiota bacterium]
MPALSLTIQHPVRPAKGSLVIYDARPISHDPKHETLVSWFTLTITLPLSLFAQSVGNFPLLPSKVLSTYTVTAPEEQHAETMAKQRTRFWPALRKDG